MDAREERTLNVWWRSARGDSPFDRLQKWMDANPSIDEEAVTALKKSDKEVIRYVRDALTRAKRSSAI